MESEGLPRPPPDKGTVTVEAVVIGTTADGRIRLRLENGSEQHLSVPDELSEWLRPGVLMVLYHGPDGELLGWFLPEHEIGQDLRH